MKKDKKTKLTETKVKTIKSIKKRFNQIINHKVSTALPYKGWKLEGETSPAGLYSPNIHLIENLERICDSFEKTIEKEVEYNNMYGVFNNDSNKESILLLMSEVCRTIRTRLNHIKKNEIVI